MFFRCIPHDIGTDPVQHTRRVYNPTHTQLHKPDRTHKHECVCQCSIYRICLFTLKQMFMYFLCLFNSVFMMVSGGLIKHCIVGYNIILMKVCDCVFSYVYNDPVSLSSNPSSSCVSGHTNTNHQTEAEDWTCVNKHTHQLAHF